MGAQGRDVSWLVRSSLLLLVLVVGLALAFAAPSVPASSGPRSLAGTPPGFGGVPPPPDSASMGRAAADELRGRRAGAEAGRRREQSRRAFHGQSRDEAISTAREQFGEAVGAPLWQPFSPGDRPSSYVGDSAVRLAGGPEPARRGASFGPRDALMESTVPLRVRNDSGALAAVDLGLQDRGDHFRSANPIVPIDIAKSVGGGLSFGDIGVRVVPSGGGSDATLVSGKPFYANTSTDTDTFVQPAPGGAEISWQLRSENSPDQLRLTFDVPSGAALRAAGDGSGAIEVARGANVLAVVPPPGAKDADGQPVAVTQTIDGNDVVVHVDHRGADVKYPLLVDPWVLEDQDFWSNDTAPDHNGWTAWAVGSFAGGYGNQGWGNGFYLYSLGNYPSGVTYFNAWDYGEWYFAAPANTVDPSQSAYVFRAEFYDAMTAPSTGTGCTVAGIYSFGTWSWEAGRFDRPSEQYYHPSPSTDRCSTFGGNYEVHCTGTGQSPQSPACAQEIGHPPSAAVFMLTAPYAGNASYMVNYLAGARVYEYDRSPPTISAVSHSNLPADWTTTDVSETVTASAWDGGMGIQKMGVYRKQSDGTFVPVGAAPSSLCAGDRNNRCPQTSQRTIAYNTSGFPDGDNTLDLIATDVIGNQSVASAQSEWHVKIDRTAPTLGLSGSLLAADGQTVTAAPYGLHIVASDNDSSNPASGVKRVEVQIDGDTDLDPEAFDQSCPNGGCGSTVDYSLYSQDLFEGQHTVRVVASDQLGHVRTSAPITIQVNNAAIHAADLAQWKSSLESAVDAASPLPLNGSAPAVPDAYAHPDSCTTSVAAIAACFDANKTWARTLDTWLTNNGVAGSAASGLPDLPLFGTPASLARTLARTTTGAYSLVRAAHANPLARINVYVSFHGPVSSSYLQGLNLTTGISDASSMRGTFEDGSAQITAGYYDPAVSDLSTKAAAFNADQLASTDETLQGLNEEMAASTTDAERAGTQSTIDEVAQFKAALTAQQPLVTSLATSATAVLLSNAAMDASSPIKSVDILSVNDPNTDAGAAPTTDKSMFRAADAARQPPDASAADSPAPRTNYMPSRWTVRTRLNTSTSYPYTKRTLMYFDWTRKDTLKYFRGDHAGNRGFEAEGRPSSSPKWSTGWQGNVDDRGHSWNSNMPDAYRDDLYQPPAGSDTNFAIGTGTGRSLKQNKKYYAQYGTNRGEAAGGTAWYDGQATRRAVRSGRGVAEWEYCHLIIHYDQDSACFFANGTTPVEKYQSLGTAFHSYYVP